MKDIKEQMLEILNHRFQEFAERELSFYEKRHFNYVASEIESLIKENYVEKEFVEWLHGKDYLYDRKKETWITSLESAHDYWLKELKSKQEIK